MELVEGVTLAERLKNGSLSIEDTIRFGAEICDALSAAHARGIVHRDLKPANVMVTRHGAKVLDFGLAKLHEPPGDTLTATDAVMGTPAYMAPEQIEGRNCDARTDIFAVGLMLLEMATGKRQLVAHGQQISLDGLPSQFAHVVERCLAREPEQRWQSASDVKAELEWAGSVRSAARGKAVGRVKRRGHRPGWQVRVGDRPVLARDGSGLSRHQGEPRPPFR
jgi:serine/threonine protein kinase